MSSVRQAEASHACPEATSPGRPEPGCQAAPRPGSHSVPEAGSGAGSGFGFGSGTEAAPLSECQAGPHLRSEAAWGPEAGSAVGSGTEAAPLPGCQAGTQAGSGAAPGSRPGAEPQGSTLPQTAEEIWYVSYGANMHRARLRYYLAGGSHPGGARTYPGCRDPRMPRRSVAVELPGTVYFATESAVWTGGRAFYDAGGAGRMWGRAHLITAEQFSDIAAQEMYRAPGRDLDLGRVLAEGRVQLGPGRYETLVHPGDLDGVPLLTFTAPWTVADVEGNPPSAPYLRHLTSGLMEAGRWEAAAVAGYLASRPGAAGHWTPEEVAALSAPPDAST